MEKSLYTQKAMILGNVLEDVRLRAGLDQKDVAEKLDTDQSFVSRYERGERRLDIIQVRTICQICGIDLVRFIELFERQLEAHRVR